MSNLPFLWDFWGGAPLIMMGNGGLDEDGNVPPWGSLYTVPQNERYGVICVR